MERRSRRVFSGDCRGWVSDGAQGGRGAGEAGEQGRDFDGAIAGGMAGGEQEKEQGAGAEDPGQGAVDLQRGDQQHGTEEAPEQQIGGKRRCPGGACSREQKGERKPEKAVAAEGDAA